MVFLGFALACAFAVLLLMMLTAVFPAGQASAATIPPWFKSAVVPAELVVWLALMGVTYATPDGSKLFETWQVFLFGGLAVYASWVLVSKFPGRQKKQDKAASVATQPAGKPPSPTERATSVPSAPGNPAPAGTAKSASTLEEVIALLQPWRDRHSRNAWKPSTISGESEQNPSKFSGTPWLKAEEAWPQCATCHAPMPLFLQLDLGSLPSGARAQYGNGLLQLFYCMACDDTWDAFSPTTLVRIVERAAVAPTALEKPALAIARIESITSWRRIDDFPHSEEQEELGLVFSGNFNAKPPAIHVACSDPVFEGDIAIDEDELGELTAVSGDKLGGWPLWVQSPEYPSCPTCGTRMNLLFQLDSEDHLDYMFGDVGVGHVTQCPVHKDVVAFGWACS